MTTSDRQLTPFEPFVHSIETNEALDGPAEAIAGQVRKLLGAGPAKDALSGTWLGHAVHPMLTDVVIGCFLSATLLDLFAGERAAPASERLIAIGALAYGPTALAGINDWADTEPADERVRRAGLVHASGNAVALTLYLGSLAARRRGARRRGTVWGVAGSAVLMVGGYLGGHLSLRRGVGPDQTVYDPGPTDWKGAGDGGQLEEGKPTRVVVDDTPVLLLRQGGRLFAIHDRCSHRGCSLSEGEVEGEDIVCGCHGSRFGLADGSVKRGRRRRHNPRSRFVRARAPSRSAGSADPAGRGSPLGRARRPPLAAATCIAAAVGVSASWWLSQTT